MAGREVSQVHRTDFFVAKYKHSKSHRVLYPSGYKHCEWGTLGLGTNVMSVEFSYRKGVMEQSERVCRLTALFQLANLGKDNLCQKHLAKCFFITHFFAVNL